MAFHKNIVLCCSDSQLRASFLMNVVNQKRVRQKQTTQPNSKEPQTQKLKLIDSKQSQSRTIDTFYLDRLNITFIDEKNGQANSANSLLLLLNVKDDISESFLQFFKSKIQQDLKLLIVINRLTQNIKERTLKNYQKQIRDFFSEQVKVQLTSSQLTFISIDEKDSLKSQEIIKLITENLVGPLQESQQKEDFNDKQLVEKFVEKFSIDQKQQCIKEILCGNLDEIQFFVTKRNQKKTFLAQVNELYQAITSRKNNSSKSIPKIQEKTIDRDDSLQKAKNNAIQEIKQLLEKYSLDQTQQDIKAMLQDDIEDVLLSIHRSKRSEFSKYFQESMPNLRIYQQILKKQGSNLQVQHQKEKDFKKIAQKKVLQIIKKYQIKNQQQCLEQILEGNLQDAALNVSGKKQRQFFLQQLGKCPQLNDFLNPKTQNQEKLSLEQLVKTKLITIVQSCKILDSQECLQHLLKNQIEDALKLCKSKIKQELKILLNQCTEFQIYLQQKFSPEVIQDSREKAKSDIIELLKKYHIKQKLNSFSECLLQNDTQAILKDIKADRRKSFGKDFQKLKINNRYFSSQAQEYSEKQESQKGKNSRQMKQSKVSRDEQRQIQFQDKLKQAVAKDLLKILEKYNVTKVKQCLNDIFSKNIKNMKLNVKKAQRDAFEKQIFENELLSKYFSFLSQTSIKSDPLQKKVSLELQLIFENFEQVQDIKEMIKLTMEENYKEVSDNLREQNYEIFRAKIKQCKEFNNYLERQRLLNNKLKNKIMKIISSTSKIQQGLLNSLAQKIQTESNLLDLKKTLPEADFYKILNLFYCEKQFIDHVKNNQPTFSENLVFFYYLQSIFPQNLQKIDQTLDFAQNFSNNSSLQLSEKYHWIESKIRNKDPFQIVLQLQQQATQLDNIKNYAHVESFSQLILVLNEIKQHILIQIYYQIDKSLTELQKEISGKANQSMSNAHSYSNNPKQQNLMKMKEKCLEKLNISKIQLLCEKYSKFLKSLRIEWEDVSNQCYKKTNDLKENLKAKKLNLASYLKSKTEVVQMQNLLKCHQLFQKQIQNMFLKISYQSILYQTTWQVNQNGRSLILNAAKILSLEPQNLVAELEYGQSRLFLKQQQVIHQKPNLLRVFQKSSLVIKCKQQIIRMDISKDLSVAGLKDVITYNLKLGQSELKDDMIELWGVFENIEQPIQISEPIATIQLKQQSKLRSINVKLKMKVTVYYQIEECVFYLDSQTTVVGLKKHIFERIQVPTKSQSLFFEDKDKEKQVFNEKLQELQTNDLEISFTLLSKMALEHFGFHENYQIKFNQYNQFYVEKQGDLKKMVDSCTFKDRQPQKIKQEEKNFFNQLIKFLFSAVKRRFRFRIITKQVASLFIEIKSFQIWSGGDFNDQFLSTYILYNSESKLRIEMMNVLRGYMTLPIYFQNFKSINDVRNQWQLNKQLVWLLHPGLYITSIGLHNNKNEKGKTYINNLLFFTQFSEFNSKHPICQNVPEISLKILDKIASVNLIDIPSGCPDSVSEQILKITHLLIIHSYKGRNQTEKCINQIKEKHQIKYIICIERDAGNIEQTIQKVKNFNYKKNIYLNIHNVKQSPEYTYKQPPSFIQTLRNKIWLLCQDVYNDKQYINSKTIFNMFNNQLFNDFHLKSTKIQSVFSDMKIVFNKYEEIKSLTKQNKPNSNVQIENIKNTIIQNKISKELEDIFLYIQEHKRQSDLLMLRFRQMLREIKNQKQKPYSIINQYKKKLQQNLSLDQFLQLQRKAIQDIEKLPGMRKVNSKGNVKAFKEELASILEFFENQIKSKFFSIQSTWRELQYLTNVCPSIKLGQTDLLDFLIEIKRKQIGSSQPFQLLDGDLLQMPKNITKKVFEGLNQKVAIITVLGPQSSGKSTLLNFLFGCDFGTSEGRCTKGVYGTFFEFSNINLPNCSGVFLIDTEGLFAEVNKKDAARRKDFDAKLVLFCLSVSDFVIVNTKGNLDATSTKILRSAMDRFSALAEQNILWPQIYLILNQNSSGNLNASLQDVNKLRQFFSVQNSHSLNIAYEFKQLDSNIIQMLPKDQNVVKKTPRREFLTLTNKVQFSLINKIQNKFNFKNIQQTIDLMERVWSTIQAFPNLGKTISKKLQEIQKDINSWRLSKIDELSQKRQQLFVAYRSQKTSQKRCFDEFQQLTDKFKLQFKGKFRTQKIQSELEEQENMKVQLQQNKIQLAFKTIEYELNNQIKDLQKSKVAAITKAQGSQYEREAIRQVKAIQRKQNRELSDKQKQQYFNRAFDKMLNKLQKISAPQDQALGYFERIEHFYQSCIKLSGLNKKNAADKASSSSAGLPKCEWKCELDSTFVQFSKKIRGRVIDKIGSQSNQYIEYRQSKPTMILNQTSNTDAKLEYFNMREYFQNGKISAYIQIPSTKLFQSIKMSILSYQIQQLIETQAKIPSSITDIFQKLNTYFNKYNLKLKSVENFKQCYDFENKFCQYWTKKPQLIVEIIYQNHHHSTIKNSYNQQKPPSNNTSLNTSSSTYNYPYHSYNSSNSSNADYNSYNSNSSSTNSCYNNNSSSSYYGYNNQGSKNASAWNNTSNYQNQYKKTSQYTYLASSTNSNSQKYNNDNYGYQNNSSSTDSTIHPQKSIQDNYSQNDSGRQNYLGESKSKMASQKNIEAIIKKYIDLESIKKKFQELCKKSSSDKDIRTKAKHYSNCIQGSLQWKNIRKQVEQSNEFSNIVTKINRKISQHLNEDLGKINLSIECQNFYELIMKDYYFTAPKYKIIRADQKIPLFKNETQFLKLLQTFMYFDYILISSGRNKSEHKSQNKVQLGMYQTSIFQVKQKYAKNQSLKKYLSKSTSQVYLSLQSWTMKQFVFKQLKSKEKFEKLFDNIDNAILSSSRLLESNTINEVYVEVSRQITKFNDDLNQVSHKLTLLFTGYIHLYAVYLSWKKHSHIVLAESNKSYQSLLKEKGKSWEFFKKSTSNKQNDKIQAETTKFLDQVKNYLKTMVKTHKDDQNCIAKQYFKKNYSRDVIQKQIDLESFDIASKQEQWVDYLQNPAKVIEAKYSSKIQLETQKLKVKYKKCQNLDILAAQFKKIMLLLQQTLKKNKVTQDTGPTDLFSIEPKTNKQISVKNDKEAELIGMKIMDYMLDLMTKDQRQKYEEVDFNLVIKKDFSHIKLITEIKPAVQIFKLHLKKLKLSITKLYPFVESINIKLDQNVEVNKVLVNKFQQSLKDLQEMTTDDAKTFRSLVEVKICKQLCPGCQRICGVQQLHTKNHQCKYGHQMRALGGVKLTNDEASVLRCQDVDLMSPIKFNGHQMTWKEFKQFWEAKPDGSWSFNDLKTKTNDNLFRTAWDIAGKYFCKKYSMNFVQSNQLQKQMVKQIQNIHFIYALDDSGSMSGARWNDLMVVFKESVEKLKKIPNAQSIIRVTILIQGTNCIIHQQNVTPNSVNTNITPRFCGNNFTDTFSKAYSVMQKYVGGANIKYAFMTDGGCGYPLEPVINIKKLQNTYPGKIEYFGIQFQSHVKVMKTISNQLGGTNSISYSAEELKKAFAEVIDRKV